MLGVTKTDSAENDLYEKPWGESGLTANDKLFFLSARELVDYVGTYQHAPGRTATDAAHSAGRWWLRSPNATFSYLAGMVLEGGDVVTQEVRFDWTARPAFNLDLNSVLFTSAAEGGKPDGGLTEVPEYTGNEWKLTLLDKSRSFTASVNSSINQTEGYTGWTVDIQYTGAGTGNNEYVSAMQAGA